MDDIIKLVDLYKEAKTVEEQLRHGEALATAIIPELELFVRNAAYSAGKPSLGDDIVQETLVLVLKGLNSFRGKESRQFWAWIYRIARNRLIDHLRSPTAGNVESLDFESLKEVIDASIQEEPLKPGEMLDIEEVLETLRASRPEGVNFIWCRFVLQMTWEEIASEYRMTADAVRQRVKRCLEEAKKLLKKKRRGL